MTGIIAPHDRRWAGQYAAAAKELGALLGENARAIHHIGSTAVPPIMAKPIIDILVEALDLDRVDSANAHMAACGYRAMGQHGIDGRRYFQRDDESGTRTHHVHVFRMGSPHVARHLAFRDYLRAHPEEALAYSRLKTALVRESGMTKDEYVRGKADFVSEMEARALKWADGAQ